MGTGYAPEICMYIGRGVEPYVENQYRQFIGHRLINTSVSSVAVLKGGPKGMPALVQV